MAARGLGDVVAAATKLVGIQPCGGCADRQEWLNKVLPFKGQTGHFPYGNIFEAEDKVVPPSPKVV
jgi:hypothetical protein